MKKNILILWFLILFIQPFNAQYQEVNELAYNVGFGMLTSTVGALINKKSNDPLGKVITKSLWQGALGGGADYTSKLVLREAERQDQWGYIWGAKLLNAAATSIKENAALNKDFWVKWHINFGFNRIEFNTKNQFSIGYKLMPVNFIYTLNAFFNYNFQLSNSLKIGEFVFSTPQLRNFSLGISTAGYIVFDDLALNDIQVNTHEIVHQYQSNDYSIFNTYLNKPFTRWGEQNKTINWINKHLFIEFYYLILRPLYIIERNSAKTYYDNFFEYEAGYFSDTLHP